MNPNEFDKMLERAAEERMVRELSEYEQMPEYQPSERHKERMRRLFAREKRQSLRRIIARYSARAAIIACAVALAIAITPWTRDGANNIESIDGVPGQSKPSMGTAGIGVPTPRPSAQYDPSQSEGSEPGIPGATICPPWYSQFDAGFNTIGELKDYFGEKADEVAQEIMQYYKGYQEEAEEIYKNYSEFVKTARDTGLRIPMINGEPAQIFDEGEGFWSIDFCVRDHLSLPAIAYSCVYKGTNFGVSITPFDESTLNDRQKSELSRLLTPNNGYAPDWLFFLSDGVLVGVRQDFVEENPDWMSEFSVGVMLL